MNSITQRRIIIRIAMAFGLLTMGMQQSAHAQNWTPVGSTPNASFAGRWSPACMTIGTGSTAKVYLGGGYVNNSNAIDFWEFNPADKQWLQKKDIPAPDRTGGISFSINGKGYVGLGAKDFNSITTEPTPLKDLWEYDPATNQWTKKADLPDSARYESSVVVINSKAYVIGGTTGKWTSAGGYVATNDVWEYNPSNNQWTAKKPFPAAAIKQAMTFAILNKGYITCGSILAAGSFTPSATLYEYDAVLNQWTKKKDFPGAAREGGIGFTLGTKGYVGLGRTNFTSFYKDIYSYDHTTDNWSPTPIQLPGDGRAYSAVAIANNKAYMGAGWSLSGTTQKYYKDWYELTINGVGVNSISRISDKIVCYPNPCTNGSLHVNIDENVPGRQYPWKLYNLIGGEIANGQLAGNDLIDISKIAGGRYLLEVTTDRGSMATVIEVSGFR